MFLFSSTVHFGEAGHERRVAGLSLCCHRLLFLRGAHNIPKVNTGFILPFFLKGYKATAGRDAIKRAKG